MIFVVAILSTMFAILVIATQKNIEYESVKFVERIAAAPDEPKNQPGRVRRAMLIVKTDSDGDIISFYGNLIESPDEDYIRETLFLAMDDNRDTGMISDMDVRYCRKITRDGQIIVFADATIESLAMRSTVKWWIIIALLAIGAFLAVSILLSIWTVKPIDEAWKQQRQFVADASHELKTPLTVITTNAELLSGECTDEDRTKFTSNILVKSRQMRGLVERLLELARVDNAAERAEFRTISLSDIVADSLLPFEPVFFEQNMSLISDIEPDIYISGNAEHIRQTAEILLDNAQKYSSKNGKTVVTLSAYRKDKCRFTVSNTGEPIDEAELENIFKRFYRSDKARVSDGSYGLGLSIAKAVADEHAGKIWAESKNGMNTFCIELPTIEK